MEGTPERSSGNGKKQGVMEKNLQDWLARLAQEGTQNAAEGIASMVGQNIRVMNPVVRSVPVLKIPSLLGSPETEAVGIYLRSEGEIGSQIILVVSYPFAMELVDLMMGLPAGETRELGRLERSALAELGNLAASFFLNAMARTTGLESRPSPPAVMVDMVGAILNVLLASMAGASEQVMMIQATFLRGEQEAQVEFWVIPDQATLDALCFGEPGC